MSKKERYLFYTYLFIGLFLFFGSYNDRVTRASFLGKTIFLPLTYSANEFRTMRKLRRENEVQRLLIGELFLKTINQQSQLKKFENSQIDFPIADTTYILADVIGYSGDFFGRTIIVSKGLMDGVKKDNPVFSSKGIVGKVVTAYQNFSIVLPINHSNFKLAVLNQNTGVQGILAADVYSQIGMDYLRFGTNVSIGDTIVTSNLSQVFPVNFPIGRVVRLQESPDALYFRAIIQPFNDISNVQNVFILLKEKKELDEIEMEMDY